MLARKNEAAGNVIIQQKPLSFLCGTDTREKVAIRMHAQRIGKTAMICDLVVAMRNSGTQVVVLGRVITNGGNHA
jgi:predicted aconitase with swiveling domain